MEKAILRADSCGSQRLQSKDGRGCPKKMYHVNMLKKYIAREPEIDVVPTSITDGASVAVARVIHKATDPELGKVPDLEGHRQREGD